MRLKIFVAVLVLLALFQPVLAFNISGYVNDAESATAIKANVSIVQNGTAYNNITTAGGYYQLFGIANTTDRLALNVTNSTRKQYYINIPTPADNSDRVLNFTLVANDPTYTDAAIIGVGHEGLLSEGNASLGIGSILPALTVYVYNATIGEIYHDIVNDAGYYEIDETDGAILLDDYTYTVWGNKTDYFGSPYTIVMNRTDALLGSGATYCAIATGDPCGARLFYGNTTWGTEDCGVTWKVRSAAEPYGTRSSFGCSRFNDGTITIFGGDDPGTAIYYNDSWRSSNNGTTWSLANSSPGWKPRGVELFTTLDNGNIVMVGGYPVAGDPVNNAWISADKGVTWTVINSSIGFTTSANQAMFSDGNTNLYVIEDYTTKTLIHSQDTGATWHTERNLPVAISNRTRYGLAQLSDNDVLLFGGAHSGTYGTGNDYNDTWLSEDYGETWTQVNATGGWVARADMTVATLPDDSVIFFGGVGWYPATGITYNDTWRTTNRGATWERMS